MKITVPANRLVPLFTHAKITQSLQGKPPDGDEALVYTDESNGCNRHCNRCQRIKSGAKLTNRNYGIVKMLKGKTVKLYQKIFLKIIFILHLQLNKGK